MLETMNDAIIIELVKNIWWGIVFIATIYFIADTIRINKARELKVRLKELKWEQEHEK